VSVSRYSYSVPAGGVLDLIQVHKPMILGLVCVTASALAPNASVMLQVLNGEGAVVFQSASTIAAQLQAAPEAFVFSEQGDNGVVAAVAGIGVSTLGTPGGSLPPRFVVLPGETVRVTCANVTASQVVVTWREP